MLWKRNKVNDEIVIADYNKKNATVTDEMFTVIFSDVGRRYGFSEVRAKVGRKRKEQSLDQCLLKIIMIPPTAAIVTTKPIEIYNIKLELLEGSIYITA